MNTKLTLKLDEEVIKQSKAYAATHQRSLSNLIETYLKILIGQDKQQTDDDIELSPFVKSMATGHKIPANINHKLDYLQHITEKHT